MESGMTQQKQTGDIKNKPQEMGEVIKHSRRPCCCSPSTINLGLRLYTPFFEELYQIL